MTDEPELRVLRVCVLVRKEFGDDNAKVTIHHHDADAMAELQLWASEKWDEVAKDWELGPKPDDAAEMYEQFRAAALGNDDFEWQIYENVPLDLSITIVPAEFVEE